MTAPLLDARGLEVDYGAGSGAVRALDGVDLRLEAPEVIGIVGESGSGKSTLGLAVGRLLPGIARRAAGDLRVDGVEVFGAGDAALRELRRRRLGFVFQNPMTALDPTARIGRQLGWRLDGGDRASAARTLLDKVGLPDHDRVLASYPHQLSGGMAQRVVIAMAIARGPSLLIADEPTASLDATLRDRILELLVSLHRGAGMAVVLLSHELRVVARHCTRVAVMYGGRVVEDGPTGAVFDAPAHPYTRALIGAAPGRERPGEALRAIPGAPPLLRARAEGCAFAPRCPAATDLCRKVRPEARQVAGRRVLCHHAAEVG